VDGQEDHISLRRQTVSLRSQSVEQVIVVGHVVSFLQSLSLAGLCKSKFTTSREYLSNRAIEKPDSAP